MNTGLQNWTSADSLGRALHIPAASPVSRRACGTHKGLGRGKRKVFSQGLVNSLLGYKLRCALNQIPSVLRKEIEKRKEKKGGKNKERLILNSL